MKYAIFASFLLLTGCINVEVDREAGPPTTDEVSIDRGKAEMVRMEVKMSVGELRIDGGASKLLEGTLRYNTPFMKPNVRYDATGFRGHLTIEQSSDRTVKLGKNVKNDWNLHLNDDTPLDLLLNMGVGENHLNLGSLSLRRVEVHMGVGELKMDLRGTPKKDYDVDIRGGVGEATVYLPANVGVIANAKGGIGGISAQGNLKKDGSSYVNPAYGNSKVTIRLDVRGGIGQINLIGD